MVQGASAQHLDAHLPLPASRGSLIIPAGAQTAIATPTTHEEWLDRLLAAEVIGTDAAVSAGG